MTAHRGQRRFAAVATAALIGLAVAPAAFGAGAAQRSRQVESIAALLPPVAVNDTMTVKHDRTKNVAAPGVLANDIQLGSGYTAVLTTDVARGTLDLNSDGSYSYTPDSGYVGADSFKYRVNGGLLGLSNIATVSITVTNVAPVAGNDSYAATTGVTLNVSAPGVLGDDSDGDGDNLTAILVDGSGNGSLDLNSNGSFTFTSGGSFTGSRTFTYKASDGIASSNTATVTITVSAPPATPTPAPTPTPPPTATPRPTPTPTPRPTPTPIIPLPTLPPLPTPTLPPLPTLLPTPTPTPTPGGTPTPGATTTPGASPTATPGSSSQPSPGSSTTPTLTPSPGPGGTASPAATPGTGATGAPGAGAGTSGGSGGSSGGPATGLGAAPGDRFLLPSIDPTGIDAIIDASFTGFGGIEWAVPAFTLGVPGFLLMIAVAIQAVVGAAWLPVVRRWLGGFGVRRRQRSA